MGTFSHTHPPAVSGSAVVLRADAAHLPLPDSSVDLVVTSPPYFALRSYQDGGQHYAKQIGAEATPQEFLEALWACTAEWMRVLKPSGSIFVNLGDKYATAGTRQGNAEGIADSRTKAATHYGKRPAGFRDKSLMLLPERYRIGCVDRLGLVARSVIIWDKPNGLPESVTDRVRRSHEDWVHLTKLPRYFSAIDEIREPHESADRKGLRSSYKPGQTSGNTGDGLHVAKSDAGLPLNSLGKLPGSVWTVATEPLNVPDHLGVDHFAAFPTEWPRRIIQGWSPAGICTACDEGRRPVSQAEVVPAKAWAAEQANQRGWHGETSRQLGIPAADRNRTITGYACACPTPDAPTRPSTVVDPFGGTGTTALCASVLGRIGISVDLSADYGRLAQWRTQDPSSRAKAMRVEKPPVQLDGQIDMFGGAA